MIKWLIIANGAVMALCWVLFILLSLSAADMFKRKHPWFSCRKMFWGDIAYVIIKFILVTICPILNISMVYVLLSKYDDFRNEAVRKAEIEYNLDME